MDPNSIFSLFDSEPENHKVEPEKEIKNLADHPYVLLGLFTRMVLRGEEAIHNSLDFLKALNPEVDLEAIKNHKLYNLSDFLPKKPTDVELKVMKEMFEASVDGEAYDMERWGQYFKPAGMGQATGDPHKPAQSTAPVAKSRPAPVASEDDLPWDDAVATSAPVAAPSESTNRAQDILAMIRNRKQ